MQRHAAYESIVLDDDIGAFLHMAVLAAAEHVQHLGIAANGDLGGVDKGIVSQQAARNASARTEHPTLVCAKVLEGRVGILGK